MSDIIYYRVIFVTATVSNHVGYFVLHFTEVGTFYNMLGNQFYFLSETIEKSTLFFKIH